MIKIENRGSKGFTLIDGENCIAFVWRGKDMMYVHKCESNSYTIGEKITEIELETPTERDIRTCVQIYLSL